MNSKFKDLCIAFAIAAAFAWVTSLISIFTSNADMLIWFIPVVYTVAAAIFGTIYLIKWFFSSNRF